METPELTLSFQAKIGCRGERACGESEPEKTLSCGQSPCPQIRSPRAHFRPTPRVLWERSLKETAQRRTAQRGEPSVTAVSVGVQISMHERIFGAPAKAERGNVVQTQLNARLLLLLAYIVELNVQKSIG